MASRLGMNGADRRMETRDLNESGSSPEKRPSHTSASINYNGIGPKPYSYGELARVTGHFSLNNLIGRGGFGHVFKAFLDGEIRAIKRFDFLDVQSEGSMEREIMVIKSVSHRNLVELVGYCIDGANRLLILKYFPNGSLRFKLHESENVLDWKTRMKIAIGSARGLEYLHEHCKPKIIHLDIKPDNILLDEDFEPKITDFGLAQFFTEGATHISKSSVMETHVYEDPFTTKKGKYSDKSDIYSFGVTLLELITGRKPIYNGIDIITWANPLIEDAIDGRYANLIDSKLQSFNHKEMYRMIFCVNSCLDQFPNYRPTMEEIRLVLEGKLPPEKLHKYKLRWSITHEANEPKSGLKRSINQETNKPGTKPPVIRETKNYVTRKGPSTSRRPTEETSNGSSNTIRETSFDERNQVYEPRRFTYHQLRSATQSFAENNLLSGGLLGEVYKGNLIDGVPVIVKKFYTHIKEDKFMKIKDTSTSVHDKNLVNLIGYCDERDNRSLVYEFFPDKSSLRSHLRDNMVLNGRSTLDWPTRMEIALRIARGLAHLYDRYKPWNIYEHYKDNSIFLDDSFEPKFAEYARDKFFLEDSGNSINRNSMSSRYVKLDVYFFGVILLEIITGKLPVSDISSYDSFNLIEWAVPVIRKNWLKDNYKFIDEKLGRYFDKDEMDRMIECALACVDISPQNRPEMSKVVEVLAGNIPRGNLKN